MGGNRTCVICFARENQRGGFFASFPKDVKRCRAWVKYVGIEDLVYLPIEKLHCTRFVCGDHFKKKDFNKKGSKLNKRAVPTLNLVSKPLADDLFTEFPYHIGSQKDPTKKNILLNVHQIPQFSSDQTKVEVVDYAHVKKALSDNNTLLVDVKEPDEIKEHGKIPNSVNIPLGTISTALNTMSDKEFEQTYGRKKPTEDTEIIFYCMIGKRSGMAQQNAIGLGFKNLKNFIGSWMDCASKNQ